MDNLKQKALQVIAQHEELERRTDRVLGMLTSSFDWAALGRELGEIYDLITEHFELEGQGGYMQGVREALPVRSAAVEELERAHEGLEETLRAIRRETAKAADAGRVRELFQQWLADLVTHEEAENRLCEEAFGKLRVS
jgi:hypothetical protein